MRTRSITLAAAASLVVLAMGGCSDAGISPLAPSAETAPPSADASHGPDLDRVAGSLLRVPHSWAFVNWSTLRGLNATRDGDGDADGTFDLDIEIDFGEGPFLQQTTEEVLCLEIVDRGDGTTDIWLTHAGLGWVTVPPGVTHYSIAHIVDSPDGDLLAARTIQPDEGDPAEFCETRPDLSTRDVGPGIVELMLAEAGNVVSVDG